MFRRAASTASPSPFYLKSKKLIEQKMRGPMPTATDVGRDMMGWSPECAKALLDNFLDAYHEIAPESLKQALTEIPTGIHPVAERIIKDWRDAHENSSGDGGLRSAYGLRGREENPILKALGEVMEEHRQSTGTDHQAHRGDDDEK